MRSRRSCIRILRARALSADHMDVAGLSGRRVLLFRRYRVGGRGRRHPLGRHVARMARKPWSAGQRVLRRRVVRPCPPRDGAPTTRPSPRSRNLRPRSSPPRSAFWRPRRRAAPFWRSPARRGRARRSTGSLAPGTAPSPIRSRSASPRRPRHRARARAARFPARARRRTVSAGVRLIPLGQTDGQRVLAALEPTSRRPRGRARADAARRHRQRDASAPISPACATRRSIPACSAVTPASEPA